MQQLDQDRIREGRGILTSRDRCYWSNRISYEELAAALGTSEGALRVAVHRLRKDFGAALRETIADTILQTGDPSSEVDDELRYFLEMSGRPSGQPRL